MLENQLKTLFHYGSVFMSTIIFVCVSVIIRFDTGKTTGGLISSKLYKPFIPAIILGIVIFAVFFINVWNKMLVEDFKANKNYGTNGYVVFYLIAVFSAFIIFVIDLITMFTFLGMSQSLGSMAEGVIMWYPPVFVLSYVVVNSIRILRDEKKAK